MKRFFSYLTLIIVFFLCVGVTYAVDKSDAISGASTENSSSLGSFTETTAGTHAAVGGDVTYLNLSTNSSTLKWQGYIGSVEGNLYLGSGTDSLFFFGAISDDQIQSVFASTDSNFNFASLSAASGADVDTVYSWSTGDSDSGTNVFNDGTKTIASVSNVPVANLTAYTSGGVLNNSIYSVGVFKDDGSVAQDEYNVLAYGVTVVNDQKDFRNSTTIDYELIVPVNQSASQTYYFFLDIE